MTDQDALTLTIWGEARGEPREGKIAVAAVMRNRLEVHYRGAQNYVDVCTAHAQFSAWTDEAVQMQAEAGILSTDPQLEQHPDPVLRECWEIARDTITGQIPDNTGGANHYLTASLYVSPHAPTWAKQAGVQPTTQIGAHVFFDVA